MENTSIFHDQACDGRVSNGKEGREGPIDSRRWVTDQEARERREQPIDFRWVIHQGVGFDEKAKWDLRCVTGQGVGGSFRSCLLM